VQAGGEARLHGVVRGDVQGVGFRYFVLRLAERAGLAGWVRNMDDGALECLAQGPKPALEELLEALRRGPAGASVTAVDVEWQPPAGDGLSGFRVVG
jgi:acylphosphatase